MGLIRMKTMKKNAKRPGICASCAQKTGCDYPNSNGYGAARCDEFDPDNCLSAIKPPRQNRELADLRNKPTQCATPVFKGLCSNCENRHTCTYPRPESGVWHCDEYE